MGDKTTHETTRAPQVFRKTIRCRDRVSSSRSFEKTWKKERSSHRVDHSDEISFSLSRDGNGSDDIAFGTRSKSDQSEGK